MTDYSKLLDLIKIDDPREVAIGRAYLNFAEAQGFPPEKIDSAFRWAQQNAGKMGGNIERAKASFEAFMAADGWSADHISEAISGPNPQYRRANPIHTTTRGTCWPRS